MKNVAYIALLISLCGGCLRNNLIPLSFNKAFDEISLEASHKNKLFCIVLTDSTQASHKNIIEYLNNDYSYLQSRAIYNIVNTNKTENKWYLKWLCPSFLPLTCVFSSDAKLIDIIPGATRESFLYTEEAINSKRPTDFHWPNQFLINKKKIIPLLNGLLEAKGYLSQGIYISSKLEQMSDSLNYPYSVYMKLVGELMEHDSISAKITAKTLLELETPSALELYKDEFISARKILYSDFNINAEPNIRVDATTISLNDCSLNEKTALDIVIYNDGERPLKISKIYLSCSCLEHTDNDKDICIASQKSHVAKFYFTPDTEGEISRDIYITSNAINMPILHIDIHAKAINPNR